MAPRMFHFRTIVWAMCVVATALAGEHRGQSAEIETWADKNLKVTQELALWLDASVENEARKAGKLPALAHGDPLDVWHDASGSGRHVLQSDAAARPIFRQGDQLSAARFNGRTTFLAEAGLNSEFRELTILIVAAPFANAGTFRGILAMNATDVNDYVSGLTIDLGPDSSREFNTLNVEGVGFGGAQNLKSDTTPFGQLVSLCVTSKVGRGGTALRVGGARAGRRDRGESTVRMDRLTIGARYYTNGGAAATRGFLAGDIAEVLVYDRALSDSELADVDRYLKTKYGENRTIPLPADLAPARPIPRVAKPPAVQMLAPGFAARQLPVDMTNINNVRYRDDGVLVASAYDGRIYLLRDTDGDGLEDRADVFWDTPGIISPIGIALAPPGYARGRGVFVACKGRVVFVADTNSDDRGDELITVADGWTPLKHSVDAMGVAVAPDASIYFGLGTEDFTNAYLLDDKQQARYRASDERSAIFKASPDFKSREKVCTGVRFSVSLAFNRHGDLFCTDQEGATWLPNGNPFDELLHIQPGRHYGFPPRHPKHLSGVIDEPSVYDYSPQHQSTCGLSFNEPGKGGVAFGPDWWLGDALVCGYSRGKLYRTKLVKTPVGYVADSALLGCLDMLTVDTCLSPRGELVVAAHSGGPDWGSGPRGKGKLYKIAYVDAKSPQPVRAWASSPHETRIAFDRPLDPRAFAGLAQQVKIEYGPNVRAGDRFESLWPGYAVVEQQMQSPRTLLPILAANITADRRSIVLTTDEHAQAVHYAVIMPPPESAGAVRPAENTLPQLPEIELTYNLSGIEATWQGAADQTGWTATLPHLDLAASEGLLVGAIESQALSKLRAQPGTLILRTQLDLWQMLRPAIQPGATLDQELPGEEVTVVLESPRPITVKQGVQPGSVPLASTALSSIALPDGRHQLTWTVRPKQDQWLPIEITVTTGETPEHTGEPALAASWHTAEDSRPRAFAPRRFMLPWARPAVAAPVVRTLAPELAGGNWQRGKEVFFGETARCGVCHAVRGKGGWIGPDLSNLVHRDYTSVLRDIANPSFAINPDHLAYTVLLADGRTLTGMVQPRGNDLCVGDIKGLETVVPHDEVESMTPALISIMPEGLPKAIGEMAMRDLLTFLLASEPGVLEPAPIERADAPPARTRGEVGAVLSGAQSVDATKLKPLEVVLCAGPKDHGVNEHDYPGWQQRWSRLLAMAPQVRVGKADMWPTPEQWKTADAILFFSANPAWAPEKAKEMDALLERGGGLVFLHFAVNGQRAPEELARRIGLAWSGNSRFRHGDLDLQFAEPEKHPITRGFAATKFVDESYWNLLGDTTKIQVLATQIEDGEPRPLLWTYEPGRGRVFCSILGHYTWTFDDPLFRILVLRGLAWTTRQPIDRFNDLATPGARVAGQ